MVVQKKGNRSEETPGNTESKVLSEWGQPYRELDREEIEREPLLKMCLCVRGMLGCRGGSG